MMIYLSEKVIFTKATVNIFLRVDKSEYNIQLLTSISVDMRIYLAEKVIFTMALRVDKPSCLPKLKSITVLFNDFLTMNENFLLSLLLLKSCST